MALRVDDVDLTRDRTLVERFQAGDDGAFDELYRRYNDRLQRFCMKRVGDPVEAEELAQEAFARAYRAMGSLGGERRFYPWISVIAARLCVDTHRRRARTSPSDDIDLGTVEGGHDEVMASHDVQVLTRAMARISERHREILVLREHEGWSYQRIAEHYGVSMGTVEALLFRARKSLRREFFILAPEDELVGRRGWLVGLPGMACLTRNVGNLRSRLAELAQPGLGQALAGGAAAVAFGGLAAFGGLQGDAPVTAAPAQVASPSVVVAANSPALNTAAVATEPEPSFAVPAPTSTPAAPAKVGQSVKTPGSSPVPAVPEGGATVGRGAPVPTSGPTGGTGGVSLTGDPTGYVHEAGTRLVIAITEAL